MIIQLHKATKRDLWRLAFRQWRAVAKGPLNVPAYQTAVDILRAVSGAWDLPRPATPWELLGARRFTARGSVCFRLPRPYNCGRRGALSR